MDQKKRRPWKANQIEDLKSAIRVSLASVPETERSSFLLAEIERHQSSLDSNELAESLLFILHLIAHEVRQGTFNHALRKPLIDQAAGILRLQGISVKNSRVSFLYRDFHILLSQAARAQGDHSGSMWQFAIASRGADGGSAYGDATKRLGYGLRLSRLGYLREAIPHFLHTLVNPDSEVNRGIALVNAVKAYRLADDKQAALELVKESADRAYPEAIRTELSWEELCHGVSHTSRPDELFAKARKPKGPFYSEAYVLESLLWLYACLNSLERPKGTNLESLRRRKEFDIGRRSHVATVCRLFEKLYDPAVPFDAKLEVAEEIYDLRNRLPGLDHHLLVLVALTRYLIRVNQRDLATLCMLEYRDLSRRCSGGSCSDIFGLLDKSALGYLAAS